jgi:AcrR family transcriptional regulator
MENLRERKKAATRDAIERRSLQLFLERGYDGVRIDELCADVLVSQRTFFRYYASKEDLVLGRLRTRLTEADQLFRLRPPEEPIADSLRGVITQVAHDYVAEPERELVRLRLVTTTPALETGLLTVFAGFERLVRSFVAARLRTSAGARRPRLLGAAVVAAFRVGLELWIDEDGHEDLPALVISNVDELVRR